ncbi:trimeric intracellular cation channel family protein [Aquariibacter albus]|uniref:Trimeric intracellular cation channel family protein n=1 Tax=Aquariibacter albus TaxID=2759899 RepID=A0A839HFP8_9BURK|nr:trimeric intracellular cation channel family protein [Aquariibacter albus]MBB1160705.1 trimeric intracellular cation channel family protein [Aquariibacter albus]
MLPPDPLSLQTALLLVEIAAIAAFALSGLMEAAHKRLDVVGALAVAGLAAFGGGTLRDVLLDRRPFFWVEHSGYVWFLLGLGLITMLWMRRRHVRPTRRAIVWPDTLGLGLFTATGTQLGLQHGMPPLIAVLMGVITAVMGGVLRDIVCNEIPSAFRDHRPYALCAFAGGWALVAARSLGADEAQALAAGATLTVLLRSAALWGRWRVPAWPAD